MGFGRNMMEFVRDCLRRQPKVISYDIHTIFIPRWGLSHKNKFTVKSAVVVRELELELEL